MPTCVWGAQPDLTQATNYQDLWWTTSGSESGWGVNLTHQGTTIFVTWFTYDANRNPLWLSATLPQTAPKTYSGTLLRTGGQAFNAVPFDPTKITRTRRAPPRSRSPTAMREPSLTTSTSATA